VVRDEYIDDNSSSLLHRWSSCRPCNNSIVNMTSVEPGHKGAAVAVVDPDVQVAQ